MVVSVSGASDLRLGTPSVLFEGHYEVDPFGPDARNYDVSPDGSRFLMIRREVDRDRPQQQLNIVVNWFEVLEGARPESLNRNAQSVVTTRHTGAVPGSQRVKVTTGRNTELLIY